MGEGVAGRNRKVAEVEEEIRKLKDDVGRAERSLEQQERRLGDLVEEEKMVWEGDRRTQERMGTLYRNIELSRHGSMVMRRGAHNTIREAAGQGLTEAKARAMGQAGSGRVKEQVEEKLLKAELQDKEAAKLDTSAEYVQERLRALQIRMNSYVRIKREQRERVAELSQDVEMAKQQVDSWRQEAARLEALRDNLKRGEEEGNKEKDRYDTKTHINSDKEEQERQRADDGKDIQAREDQKGGHHGASGNTLTNNPHHSTHGAPSEGHDEGEGQRQVDDTGEDMVVDGGEDNRAREEPEEGRHGTDGPTREEGGGDEQCTEDGGGEGGGNGGK